MAVNGGDLIHQIGRDHRRIMKSDERLSSQRQESIGILVPNSAISRDVRANHGSNEGDRSGELYRILFLQAG